MKEPTTNFEMWLKSKNQIPTPGFRRNRRHSEIPTVLADGEIKVHFQPVVDLHTFRVFAHEALLRSTSPAFQGPPAMFAEAIRTNCCGALGRVIRELAVAGCPDMPLFLNVHPNEFNEGWLVRADDPIFEHPHGVYLEITESVPLSHFSLCNTLLREIRGKGVYLAVDDLGAGYSNLKYISDLAPEIVKLDRGLISDLHKNRRLQKLVKHIVDLCVGLDARVVAEGIETADELKAVIDTGAHFGQGYFLARPNSTPPKIDPSRFR